MTGYRWHIKDPIPFKTSFRFDIEHLGWTFNNDGSLKSPYGTRDDLMSSVAYWYQDGVATGLWPVPYGSARLPQGNASQFEVETAIGQVKTEKGTAEVFKDLFWSKDVLIFKGEGPGSKLEIPFEVPEAGDYELYTQVAQGSDYGIYTVLLDGKPPVAPVLEHEPGADVRPAALLRRLRLRDLRRHGLPGRLAAADEGAAHADVRLPRQERRLDGLRARRRQHRAGAGRRGGLGEGGGGEGLRRSRRTSPARRGRSRTRTPVVRGLAARELREDGRRARRRPSTPSPRG